MGYVHTKPIPVGSHFYSSFFPPGQNWVDRLAVFSRLYYRSDYCFCGRRAYSMAEIGCTSDVDVWFGFIQVLTEPPGQRTSRVRNWTCALSNLTISLALKLAHLPNSAPTRRKLHWLGGHIHESVAVGSSTSFEPASLLQLWFLLKLFLSARWLAIGRCTWSLCADELF